MKNIDCPKCSNTVDLQHVHKTIKSAMVVCPSCGTFLELTTRSLLGVERLPLVQVREHTRKPE